MTTTATAPSPTPAPPRPVGRRVVAVLAVAVGLLLILVGVDRLVRSTDTSTQTIDATDLDAITVDVRAGRIAVTATDRDDVAVTAHATSGLLGRADVNVRRGADGLLLHGDCDGVPGRRCRIAFEVEVPRELDGTVRVRTLAGEVDLRGLRTAVDLTTRAGTVRLADFDGPVARVETTAGSIEVDAGARTRHLDLATTAGSIEVVVDDAEPLRVSATTTVGNQDLRVNQSADAERTVTAHTTAGEVRVTGR
jgi:hypothetical protein